MFGYSSHRHTVDVSPSIVIFSLALILGLFFVYYVRSILILLFLAFIVMVALNPAVTFLQKRARLPRALSAAVIYLLVIISMSVMIGLFVPPIAQDVYHLLLTFEIPFLQQEISDFRFTVTELSALADRVGSSVGVVFSAITSTFTSIFTSVTLIVMSFYLMIDRPYLHRKIQWFTRNPRHIKLAEEFVNSLEHQLGGWVRGQLILMSLIGVLTYIGLYLLNVPYALPLAVLAGLLEILPNLGPTIAAIPAVILAYASFGPVLAGSTALFYIVIQQVENNVIVPKIMKDNADVNPLVAIVTILIGFKLASVVGALLAVPSYIVIRTVYSLWYRQQQQ
ncbi:MAG TPA: AI-2E family transporter [Vitreimonas sp.]|nr:AI-2E family transporter [Vitreimonas sp.]